MKNNISTLLMVMVLITTVSCVQQNKTAQPKTPETASEEIEEVNITVPPQPHRYGGWYCPDNLYGFPAVNIGDWKTVPVINGRMATKEETQTEASLIFVDMELYPNATPLNLKMPQLGRMYNRNTEREDIIIIIQALNIDNDSIVGFRYLNGGNGSANLSEVTLISDKDVQDIAGSKFVKHTLEIRATQNEIWEVITNPEYANTLQPYFDKENKLDKNWRENTNANFAYINSGKKTTQYGDKLYGCFYVQNDFENMNYTEKFLMLEDQETGITELKIVCGPFADDYLSNKLNISQWSQEVKKLSEAE